MPCDLAAESHIRVLNETSHELPLRGSRSQKMQSRDHRGLKRE
jgi:hypothetical protein